MSSHPRIPRGRRPWVAWAVGTAAATIAAAAFTGGVVAGRYEARLGQMARETAALRQRLQRDIVTLQEQLALCECQGGEPSAPGGAPRAGPRRSSSRP